MKISIMILDVLGHVWFTFATLLILGGIFGAWETQGFSGVLDLSLHQKEETVSLTLKDHAAGSVKCSACGSKRMEQLIANVAAKTSRKS